MTEVEEAKLIWAVVCFIALALIVVFGCCGNKVTMKQWWED